MYNILNMYFNIVINYNICFKLDNILFYITKKREFKVNIY